MRTAIMCVLTLIVMSHSSAVSLKAADKDRIKNKVIKGAEKLADSINHRGVIGQPIIGKHSGGSVIGFAGIIYAIPQPPRVESAPITITIEDSLYEYQILASDANGDKILFTVLDAPSGLNVNADGLVSWTPSQENVGVNDIQIAVYDDRSDSTIHRWILEVSNQNDAPTLTLPDTLVVFDEDSSVTLSLAPFMSDFESAVADLILTVDSTLLILIDNETKSVTISGLPDSSGLFRVEFTLTDQENLSSRDTTIIIISPVNDAPVLAGIPDIVFDEDDSLVIHFEDWLDFVNDEDNADSTLIWSISTTDSDSISVLVRGDSVLFNAPENWFAFNRDTITVTVRDLTLESSIRVAVHVLPVNDAPSLSGLPDTLIFVFDSTLVIDISNLEIDIDDPDSLLEWHAEFKNHSDSLLFFNILGDSIIEITSGFEGIGEDTLILTVTDTSGASDSAMIFIQVVLSVGVDDGFDALPEKFELFQNYPNPFNPTTTIMYALPVRSDVTLRIYNLMGQEILKITHDEMSAGYHEERWNGLNQSGRKVASGIYIFRLNAGDFIETKKMLLLK
ncbi:MAG: T9SS type A sorting domain-containing protein [Candidatus Marinimicrobia bacterium]|nr:T9SS type A sorting domain-containing protein [Candidatus Neomarinimicrobiota bacterium]